MLGFDTEGYEQAVPLLREALELSPTDASAYAALSQTYAFWAFRREIEGLESQSLYERAYECAETAVRLAPERPDAHRALAIALRRGPRADQARRRDAIRRAVELGPEDAETWCELWRVEGYEPDHEALSKALSLDPRLCELHIDLGAVYCELGRYDEAVEQLVEALKLNPRNELAYYDLAMTLDRKGERGKAAALLEKARVLKPADPLLEYGLALLEGRDGDQG